MKVVAFNGSPRPRGNTRQLLEKVCEILNSEGIETEIVQIGGHLIHGCLNCKKCFENKDFCCVIKTDNMNEWIDKARHADGILIGSSTHFANITPETRALIDRLGYVNKANGSFLYRKTGAAVIAVRRGGAVAAYDAINHLYAISDMMIPGATYWNFAMGRNEGEAMEDQEGVNNMISLGNNMAWLMKKLYGGSSAK